MTELRDPSIERLYGEASREQPGAAADAAILALAREAAAQAAARTPAAGSGWTRRWHRPLALAASVVLVVGMVSRIGLEPPHGADTEAGRAGEVATARAPAAAAPAVAPAAAPPVAEPPTVVDAVKERGEAVSAKTRPADALPKPGRRDASAFPSAGRPPPEQPAQPMTAPATANAEAASPGAAPLAEAEPRPSAALSRAPLRAPEVAATMANGAAGTASTSGDLRRDAAPAPAMKSASRAARESAGVAAQDAGGPAPLQLWSEAQEAAQTPESWIRYLVELRRLGQHEAADASLKRFRARHPGHVVPPQIATPGPVGSETK